MAEQMSPWKRELERQELEKRRRRKRVKPPKFKRTKRSAKLLQRRRKGVRALLGAIGALPEAAGRRAGPGRPRETYKYRIGGRPASVFEYRRWKAQQKILYQQYQQEQMQRLAKRGISKEQFAQLQMQRTMVQPPEPAQSVPDEELQFQEFAARTTSANTQRLLDNLRRTQLKGARDDINQQRVHRERKMLSSAGNLMRAHENLRPIKLDFTGVSTDNILSAENIFKENPEDRILKPKRFNILQTKEAGHNLFL